MTRLTAYVAFGILAATASGPAAAQLVLTPQETRTTPVVRPEARPPAQRLPPPSGTATMEPQTRGNFPRRLDQRTIRARFMDGQPIASRTLGGQVYMLTFHQDGRLERVSPQGETSNGRWRFVGDAYCSRWDGNRTETCHTIVEEGQTVRVVRNTRAVATWTRPGAQAAAQ